MVGSQAENELILVHVLMALLEALNGALRTSPDKRTLLDNFDSLMLTVDELIDGGCALPGYHPPTPPPPPPGCRGARRTSGGAHMKHGHYSAWTARALGLSAASSAQGLRRGCAGAAQGGRPDRSRRVAAVGLLQP